MGYAPEVACLSVSISAHQQTATMTPWIDTHCHLDAAEFSPDTPDVVARAVAAGVVHCVLPAVAVGNFERVRLLAHQFGYSYALGIHPLCVGVAQDSDLASLDAELARCKDDPRLVAVGEIGLDYFVPALNQSPLKERQEHFYREQLKLARKHGLPVILHVRRSADKLLKHLRALAPPASWSGIAHAFNGSEQQANEFLKLGFKLGFGGTITFEAALQLRRLAATLPLDALVMKPIRPTFRRSGFIKPPLNAPWPCPKAETSQPNCRASPNR
jgi:TatD DNase family protein